jgi:glycosyltransferase involved in cell wall biosynthesis
MKIAFVSVRGIPNQYGGFEQFAEYISTGLVLKGHEVTVYSPSYHPYKESEYKGVKIVHIYSPEKWLGSSIGSFFYDFFSLKHALKKCNYDIIYEAGYTSIIPAFLWFNVKTIKYPIVVTNMDGLEFRRTKFSWLVRKFVEWEEKKAVQYSHYLIADNMGIFDYYRKKYGKESKFLSYGADIHANANAKILSEFGLKSKDYYLLIARLEPENNVEMAILGYKNSSEYGKRLFVVVGKTNTKYGSFLYEKYGKDPYIKFLGGIYDFEKIDSIRHFSYAYFHGHSVGGTNPSLLEAMASGCFILAHDNEFNRAVLKGNALYYVSDESVSSLLNKIDQHVCNESFMIENNIKEIESEYSWKKLVDDHDRFFKNIIKENL